MKNEATPKGSNTNQANNNLTASKDLGKLKSMLYRFANGARYHRFTAEQVGDHCLPTTITDLQKRYGILFDRKRVKVRNRFGTLTSVCLYWLSGNSLLKARRAAGIDKEAA